MRASTNSCEKYNSIRSGVLAKRTWSSIVGSLVGARHQRGYARRSQASTDCVNLSALRAMASPLLSFRCEPPPRLSENARQRSLVCRRHQMDAGDAGDCGERLDQPGADALPFGCRIGGALQLLHEAVGNDAAEEVLLHPAGGFGRAQRRNPDQQEKVAQRLVLLEPCRVTANDLLVHAELRLRELRPG